MRQHVIPVFNRATLDDGPASPEAALIRLREELAAHHERLRAFMVSDRFGASAHTAEFDALLREGDVLYARLEALLQLQACQTPGAIPVMMMPHARPSM